MSRLQPGMRRKTVNRGRSKGKVSRPRKLCLNRYCQQGVSLDRILNQIFVFDTETQQDLREKSSMREDLPVFRCDICGNLSQGRLDAEGNPIRLVASPLFYDSYSQTVEYHPAVFETQAIEI